jgi:hypothetical protein
MNDATKHPEQDRQRIAEAVRHGLFANDTAARSLGMVVGFARARVGEIELSGAPLALVLRPPPCARDRLASY